MKCPKCGKIVFDTNTSCPYCRTKFIVKEEPIEPPKPAVKEEQNIKGPTNETVVTPIIENKDGKEKQERANNWIFIVIIIIGVIIGIILVVYQFGLRDKQKENTDTSPETKVTISSLNVGTRYSIKNPAKVGDIALCSIYDETNQKTSYVDVKVIKFLTNEEVKELNIIPSESMYEDYFEWVGLEYQVNFNDLIYLKDKTLLPVLKSSFYDERNFKSITIDDTNYAIKTYDYYGGSEIKNGESAIVYVVYQIPTDFENYKICLGVDYKTMSCFSKK